MDIKPLGVVMSVRDFPIAWYWIHRSCQENRVDLLIIKNMTHDKAHQEAKKFFMEHKEYTHLIIINEDIIVTPSHLKLLLEDIEMYPNAVIGGYAFPVSKRYPKTNLSLTPVRGYVVFADQYNFLELEDVITRKDIDVLVKAFFNGNTLTAYPRYVVEKLSFKPYKWVYDSTLGIRTKRGIMFDLQISRELERMNIPLLVDLRLMVIHFGDTRRFIDLKGKKEYTEFIKYS